MSQCRIILENYNGTYYNGDTIIGKVDCYFDHDINVRSVKIRIRCNEQNQWTDSEEYLDESDNRYKTRWVEFVGDKDVLFMEQKLFTSEHSQALVKGQHTFPFTMDLPEKIPSTFSGPYGCIRYEMIAVVDIPLRIDYEDRYILNVISLIDLNQFPESSFHEMNYSDEKSVCCWCCQGGNISMDVDFPKIAFVPGEAMNFNVKITNLSSENVENIHVSFEKITKYIVTSPSDREKTEVENIATINDHGVGAHGEHVYGMEIIVPEDLEIHNFDLCTLFSTTYNIDITAKTPSCSTDLNIVINPEFGHIQKGQLRPQRQPGFMSPTGGNYPPPVAAYPPPAAGDYPPPVGGTYPIGGTYPPVPRESYPPPVGDSYSPSAAGSYPPPAAGSYPPPAAGSYPPPAAGSYPPPVGGSYSPSQVGGVYPPPVAGNYPPSNHPYGAPQYQKAADNYPNTSPSAPPSDLPPPSYEEAQRNKPPYPPQ